MQFRTSTLVGLVALALALGAGCARDDVHSAEPGRGAHEWTSGVVDSVRPVEEDIRLFRAGVGNEAMSLVGGAATRDELVATFIDALAAEDTAVLSRLLIGPAEFIDLYFPHTAYTQPPYEMNPAFIWFQMMNGTSRGLSRAYTRFAGRTLDLIGYACSPQPIIEGPNLLWDRCVVRLTVDGEELQARLFGLILQRDGEHKFVTYGNSL